MYGHLSTPCDRRIRRWCTLFFCLLALQLFVLPGLGGGLWATSHDATAGAEGASEEGISPPPVPDSIFSWVIAPGDTLCSIFDRLRISQGTVCRILSTDESLLALDVLRRDQTLTFTLDGQTRRLMKMELFIHPGNRVVYRRTDDGGFEYEQIILPGEWKTEFLAGEIDGCFYGTAIHAGLTDAETLIIADLFKDQLNFKRDIRAGNVFQVVRSRQFVEGVCTGQSRIEGVRIFCGKRMYSAFLFDDGNYYDSEGNSLACAFRRYPMKGHYRVSSGFNPARRHPITHRIAPHYGVDFAMPTGTPVLSTGDGVVTRIHNHPFAGKYIEIQHGSQFTTRYLHLSRILVKRRQAVKRGDRIALSGNTGRSVAPHLHFEMHVSGRPVNPLTAKIPTASTVSGEKRAEFNKRIGELVTIMEQPSQEIVLHRGENQS